MLKKLISLTLIFILAFSSVSVVFAADFSDVDAERYSWAVTQIKEMASKGIINGYPDGTFKPENGISKIEAMLLISRTLGIKENIYADYLEDIYGLYEEELDSLDLKYGNEIAFLIYKGVFTVDEIKSIANNNEFNNSLLRYEVAEYLTRAMGAYKTAEDEDTGYADESSISEPYRKYVKYVKDKGIMQGMTATEFYPDFPVNRVQMAVMMYRIMNAQNFMYIEAQYNVATQNEIEVTLSSGKGNYDITEADFYLNGKVVSSDEIKKGSDIILVFEDAVLTRIEAVYITPGVSKTVNGEVKETVLATNSRVKVYNYISGETATYNVSTNCEVYVNDSIATFSVIRTKDNVKLYLDKNDVVSKSVVLDINTQFTDGVIDSIITEGEFSINIRREDGEVEAYSASDSVVVKRNGKDAVLKDVLPGDEVSLCVLTYNSITRLEVRSEITNAKGKLSEIVISKSPSIVIERNGKTTRYPVNAAVTIKLDGKVSEIYDLRVDMDVEVTTDSGSVKEIIVSSVEDAGQISGEVEIVNASYGFINIKLTSGETKQIFVSNTTKITADGATTANKTIKNIRVGDTVVVIGKTTNGAFQATTIVILD